MYDQAASIALLFSDSVIIVPLLIIGLIWVDRTLFYHAICLVLFSMIVNVALKVSFQIPLSPLLNKKGYAFPSGHMQLVTVLYSWLAFNLKNFWFTLAVICLLISIGLSLIHFGYHNYYDLLGALFFALVLLISYYFTLMKWPKCLPWFILGMSSMLLLYIYWCSGEILSYVWMAYYALWGLIMGEQSVNKKNEAKTSSHKIVATLFCFTAILAIQVFFHYMLFINPPVSIFQLQWLLIGFIIPWANFCAVTCIEKITTY